MTRVFSLLSLLLGLTSTALAAAHRMHGEWVSSRIGGGGYVLGVRFTADPKTLYANIDVGGFYRSDDGGSTWTMLHGHLPRTSGNTQVRDVNVDPRDPRRILVATGSHWDDRRDGIFLSTDGGESFINVCDDALFAGNGDYRWAGPILARDPFNPDRIVAGSFGDGMFVSNDNGATWNHFGLTGTYFTDVKFDPRTPALVWACARNYRGWRLHVQDSTLAGGFYRSDDGGSTWTKVTDESPSEVVLPPSLPGSLVGIFDNSEIRKSADGGATWQPFHEGLPGPTPDFGTEGNIAALLATDDRLIAGTGAGQLYTRRAGDAAWRPIPRESVSKPAWVFLTPPTPGAWHHFGRAMSTIALDPRNANHLLISDWFAIWRSTDGGRSFDFAADGIENTVILGVVADPSDPAIVHLGMADNGYFRSLDGGATWARNAEVITNNIKSIVVAPTNPSRLYAVGPDVSGQWRVNAVFVSDDRGTTWRAAATAGLPDMTDRRCNSIAVDPRNADRIVVSVSGDTAVGAGGVYESTDAGQTWHQLADGFPVADGFFKVEQWVTGSELAIALDGTVLAGSADRGGVWRYSPDHRTWQQVLPATVRVVDVQASFLTSGEMLLATQSGLQRSIDSGQTWTEIVSGKRVARARFDPVVPGRFVFTAADGIFLADSADSSPVAIDKDHPAPLDAIPSLTRNRVVTGTTGSGVFWRALDADGRQPQTPLSTTESRNP